MIGKFVRGMGDSCLLAMAEPSGEFKHWSHNSLTAHSSSLVMSFRVAASMC